MTRDHYVRPADLSNEIAVSQWTLAKWRKRGHGPKWERLGPKLVRYRRSEVDRWLAECEQASAPRGNGRADRPR